MNEKVAPSQPPRGEEIGKRQPTPDLPEAPPNLPKGRGMNEKG